MGTGTGKPPFSEPGRRPSEGFQTQTLRPVHAAQPVTGHPANLPVMAHHLAVFPGSFDPITFGHLDVIRRGRRLFDELVVAVGRNPGKSELFTPEERVATIRALLDEMAAQDPAGARVSVEAYSGLTVDFAIARGASALLRGIRNLSDLQYEVQQAVTNREVADLETAFVVAGQSFAYTSSSLIKQLAALGRDLDRALAPMVPPVVIEQLKQKKAGGHPALQKLIGGELMRDDA